MCFVFACKSCLPSPKEKVKNKNGQSLPTFPKWSWATKILYSYHDKFFLELLTSMYSGWTMFYFNSIYYTKAFGRNIFESLGIKYQPITYTVITHYYTLFVVVMHHLFPCEIKTQWIIKTHVLNIYFIVSIKLIHSFSVQSKCLFYLHTITQLEHKPSKWSVLEHQLSTNNCAQMVF